MKTTTLSDEKCILNAKLVSFPSEQRFCREWKFEQNSWSYKNFNQKQGIKSIELSTHLIKNILLLAVLTYTTIKVYCTASIISNYSHYLTVIRLPLRVNVHLTVHTDHQDAVPDPGKLHGQCWKTISCRQINLSQLHPPGA